MMYCKIIWLKSWIKVNLYFPSVEEPDVAKDIPEIEEGKFCHYVKCGLQIMVNLYWL